MPYQVRAARLVDVTSEPADAELIVASWENPDVFGELFRRHHLAIYRFAVNAVGPAYGPDLAAEVFVRAFAIRRRYDPNYVSARPWLLGIAANLVAGHFRRRAREGRALRRLSNLTSSDHSFEMQSVDRVDAYLERPRIVAAMRSLRFEEARVISLFVWGGLSYSEIASELGIPEGTVRSRLSRARSRLRNSLSAYGEPSNG